MKTTHSSNFAKGYTLIELMLSVVIISILGSGLSVLFLRWLQFWQMSKANTEIQRDARTTIAVINRNLRQGTANSVVIDRLDDTQPPCSRLSFQKLSKIYIYYQKNNELFEVVDSTRSISKSLRSIHFVYPQTSDPGLISVAATFEKKTYSQQTRALHLSIEKVRIMN
ncbi:MAG: hypothetical protein BWY26_00279 [Elusimicrobia bacterium ADurb.Bin231]|nr:MAG: hypothetical protein BWY26_00279 [Elusimicrobia bacterium ADurb.Bin231]